MRRFLCGCPFEPLACVFDSDDFPVCDVHGRRLYGWASTSRSHGPSESSSATETRKDARGRVEALARANSVTEAL